MASHVPDWASIYIKRMEVLGVSDGSYQCNQDCCTIALKTGHTLIIAADWPQGNAVVAGQIRDSNGLTVRDPETFGSLTHFDTFLKNFMKGLSNAGRC